MFDMERLKKSFFFLVLFLGVFFGGVFGVFCLAGFWFWIGFQNVLVLFLVSPPRGGRGFTITSEKWSLMNNFSCVVKCHNLLRLPHKMKFLVP